MRRIAFLDQFSLYLLGKHYSVAGINVNIFADDTRQYLWMKSEESKFQAHLTNEGLDEVKFHHHLDQADVDVFGPELRNRSTDHIMALEDHFCSLEFICDL